MGQRYPQPITAAMLTPANPDAGKPRYTTLADWSNGVAGNDVDIAARSEAIANASGGAGTSTPYPIRTQTAKAAAMVPPLQVLGDIGKDYGAYSGGTGRTGTIPPKAAYPDATSPPVVSGLAPTGGGIAGGTDVVVSGTGFTGATGVTFGGTAGTAVVVVNDFTITVKSPAKSAGTVDVVVTTPKGASAAGGLADNFTYT